MRSRYLFFTKIIKPFGRFYFYKKTEFDFYLNFEEYFSTQNTVHKFEKMFTSLLMFLNFRKCS